MPDGRGASPCIEGHKAGVSMKKLCVLLAALSVVSGNAAFAQTNGAAKGKGAADSAQAGSNNYAWGIGIGVVAVIAVVVGVTAASASSDASSFSH